MGVGPAQQTVRSPRRSVSARDGCSLVEPRVEWQQSRRARSHDRRRMRPRSVAGDARRGSRGRNESPATRSWDLPPVIHPSRPGMLTASRAGGSLLTASLAGGALRVDRQLGCMAALSDWPQSERARTGAHAPRGHVGVRAFVRGPSVHNMITTESEYVACLTAIRLDQSRGSIRLQPSSSADRSRMC